MYKRSIFVLLMLASVILLARYYFAGFSQPEDDGSWQVSITAEFTTKAEKASISLGYPYETSHIKLVSHRYVYPGLRFKRQESDLPHIRYRFSSNQPGTYVVSQVYEVNTSTTARFYAPKPKKILNDQKRSEYLQLRDEANTATYSKIDKHLNLESLNKEQIIDAIFEYVTNLKSEAPSKSKTIAPLDDIALDTHGKAIYMVDLLRINEIPSRVVTGVVLQDDPVADLVYWAEAHIHGEWRSYNPAAGIREQLPVRYLALGKGVNEFMDARNVDDNQLNIEIENSPGSLMARTMKQTPDNKWLAFININRLSSEVRQQLALLLLLPLGGLITAFIRQILGIHSYGVFTPTMLALAITYTDYVTTLLVLSVTVLAVFIGRPAFQKSIDRTPRLSIIFTFVAVSMVLGISLLDVMSFEVSGHLVLLPIVILTSLIDRFFGVVEDKGFHIAMIRLFWTIVIAMALVPVLAFEWLGYQILLAPELHLYTVALLLVFAGYKGNKLSDISVFRVLNESYYSKKQSIE